MSDKDNNEDDARLRPPPERANDAAARESASRVGELRRRRLLEIQNETLLRQIALLRTETSLLGNRLREAAHREESVRHEMAARDIVWQSSRRNRYADEMSRLLRGPAAQRMRAARSLFGMIGGAASRRVTGRGRFPPLTVESLMAPQVDHLPAAADHWADWRALCGEAACPDELRELQPPAAGSKPRVALLYSGGLGDVLAAAAVAAAMKQAFAPCEIYLFHSNAIAPAILRGNNNVSSVITTGWANHNRIRSLLSHLPFFDLIADFQYCIRYIMPPQSRASTLMDEAHILAAAINARPWLKFLDDFPQRNNQLGRAAERANLSLLDVAGLTGALDIGRGTPLPFMPDMDSYDVVLGLVPTPYVTIHNGIDENLADVDGNRARELGYRSTKMLPLATWAETVRGLKAAGLAVAQIGLPREELVPGVTHDLRGLTSLSEVALLIKAAACHIDTEGGLVHLARSVNARSVVLFGPTSVVFFGYDQNVNLASTSCGDCWWITGDWFSKCARGTAGPECMLDHTPDQIVAAARTVVASKPVQTAEFVSGQLFTLSSMRSLEPLLQPIYAACGMSYAGLSKHVNQNETGLYVHASKNWEYPLILRAIRDSGLSLRPDTRIADIGGGRGALSFALGAMGASAEVFDIDFRWDSQNDPEIEDRFIANFRRVGYARFGSIFNVPADDGTFDVVTCVSVVEHIRHKRQAIAELLRILKPGGLLALTFDLVEDLDDTQGLSAEEFSRAFDTPARREIFDLRSLREELQAVGVDVMPFDALAVRRSVIEIQEALVEGIPAGMTVGGIFLRKAGRNHDLAD